MTGGKNEGGKEVLAMMIGFGGGIVYTTGYATLTSLPAAFIGGIIGVLLMTAAERNGQYVKRLAKRVNS